MKTNQASRYCWDTSHYYVNLGLISMANSIYFPIHQHFPNESKTLLNEMIKFMIDMFIFRKISNP